MMKKLLLALLIALPLKGFSAYWIDSAGTVNSITTYSGSDTILVSLSVSGTNVAQCTDKTVFAISADMPEERRARMYSMLLAAQASGRVVTVSYVNEGGCEPWGSNVNAYRKITRLR
ncbi:hypothetical protein [Reinekea sp. G2M2-21]|uniref:hypothetical protein n=1 Tax=Reinekea sp. G2M2-21 TaxID=2788942 RepID=UPI001E4FEF0A|nr:hypothetical protein [Reinekea sp. G2M2-21]